MKRVFACLSALIIVLALISCQNNRDASVTDNTAVSRTRRQTTAPQITSHTTASQTTSQTTAKRTTSKPTAARTTGVYPYTAGFEGVSLYVTVDGKKLVYDVRKSGSGGLTKKDILGHFSETYVSWESVNWVVYSTEEYPDLSCVILISGTNAVWTYKMSNNEVKI